MNKHKKAIETSKTKKEEKPKINSSYHTNKNKNINSTPSPQKSQNFQTPKDSKPNPKPSPTPKTNPNPKKSQNFEKPNLNPSPSSNPNPNQPQKNMVASHKKSSNQVHLQISSYSNNLNNSKNYAFSQESKKKRKPKKNSENIQEKRDQRKQVKKIEREEARRKLIENFEDKSNQYLMILSKRLRNFSKKLKQSDATQKTKEDEPSPSEKNISLKKQSLQDVYSELEKLNFQFKEYAYTKKVETQNLENEKINQILQKEKALQAKIQNLEKENFGLKFELQKQAKTIDEKIFKVRESIEKNCENILEIVHCAKFVELLNEEERKILVEQTSCSENDLVLLRRVALILCGWVSPNFCVEDFGEKGKDDSKFLEDPSKICAMSLEKLREITSSKNPSSLKSNIIKPGLFISQFEKSIRIVIKIRFSNIYRGLNKNKENKQKNEFPSNNKKIQQSGSIGQQEDKIGRNDVNGDGAKVTAKSTDIYDSSFYSQKNAESMQYLMQRANASDQNDGSIGKVNGDKSYFTTNMNKQNEQNEQNLNTSGNPSPAAGLKNNATENIDDVTSSGAQTINTQNVATNDTKSNDNSLFSHQHVENKEINMQQNPWNLTNQPHKLNNLSNATDSASSALNTNIWSMPNAHAIQHRQQQQSATAYKQQHSQQQQNYQQHRGNRSMRRRPYWQSNNNNGRMGPNTGNSSFYQGRGNFRGNRGNSGIRRGNSGLGQMPFNSLSSHQVPNGNN